MKTVEITVQGGIVQHVEVPEGVAVIVRDYDVEGVDDDCLGTDESGEQYIESVWTQEE